MSRYYVSAGLELTPGTDPQAAATMLAGLAETTRDEPGCIFFEVRQNIDDPQRFTLWECWTGPDALARHFEYDHTKAVLATGMTRVCYIEKLTDVSCDPAPTSASGD